MRVLIVSLVIACSSGGSAPPPSSPPPAKEPEQSAIPGVFALACEAQCSDELAQLVVYRDAQNQIGVVSVQGSPAGCSHPPLRYFGPDGKERATIPLVPVVPGSDEAKHYQAIADDQTKGLHVAEKLFCRDVKH